MTGPMPCSEASPSRTRTPPAAAAGAGPAPATQAAIQRSTPAEAGPPEVMLHMVQLLLHQVHWVAV